MHNPCMLLVLCCLLWSGWKECQCSCYSQDVAMTMREGQRCWGQDIKTYWDGNVGEREKQSGWWSCLILDFYLDPPNAHNISRLNHSGIRVCEQIRCFFFIHSCLQMLLDFSPGCNSIFLSLIHFQIWFRMHLSDDIYFETYFTESSWLENISGVEERESE